MLLQVSSVSPALLAFSGSPADDRRSTKVVKDVSAYQGSHNTYTHPSPVSTICPVDLTLGPSASYEIISDPTAPIPDLAARYQVRCCAIERSLPSFVSSADEIP